MKHNASSYYEHKPTLSVLRGARRARAFISNLHYYIFIPPPPKPFISGDPHPPKEKKEREKKDQERSQKDHDSRLSLSSGPNWTSKAERHTSH